MFPRRRSNNRSSSYTSNVFIYYIYCSSSSFGGPNFLRNFIHILLGLIIIFLESLSVLGKDHNGVCCCLKRRQVKLHTTDWLGQSGITCAVICILRACSRGASSPELVSTEVLLCLAGCLFGLQLPVEFIPCDTR